MVISGQVIGGEVVGFFCVLEITYSGLKRYSNTHRANYRLTITDYLITDYLITVYLFFKVFLNFKSSITIIAVKPQTGTVALSVSK